MQAIVVHPPGESESHGLMPVSEPVAVDTFVWGTDSCRMEFASSRHAVGPVAVLH